jgi:prepilin-type processing-associated H-X9-DG protein
MPEPSERRPKRRTGCWIAAILAVPLAGVVGVAFRCAVQDAREAARRSSCISNLKFVGAAVRSYQDRHGTFPPAYSVDKDGRPLLSWRVLIIDGTFDRTEIADFDQSQSWDSANNRALLDRVPRGMGRCELYECPSDTRRGAHETDYLMPVGTEAISDGPHGRSLSAITAGTSYTIVAGERSASGVCWTEPRDLKVDEMSFRLNDPTRPGFRSAHPRAVNVMMADGSVRPLNNDIDSEVLKSMVNISGGDKARQFFLDQDNQGLR